ncbi:MAG: DMT family transporter [Thermoleophilia bacterium]|nr:DMT family transporter [Thermoleophilia bacterium]
MSYWLAVAVMGAVGLQLAFQAPVNSRLGGSVGRLAASLVSIVVGAVLLLAVCLLTGEIAGMAEIGSAPAWALTGGLIGAFFVAGSTLTVVRLGAGTIAAAIITGQLSSSLVIDGLGWFGLEESPVTALRVGGVLLLILGTLLVVRTGPGSQKHDRLGLEGISLFAAMVLAGILIGAQPPINSALADATGGLAAALVNFLVASIAVLVLVLALGEGSRLGQVRYVPRRYLWGGPIGVITVVTSLLLVGTIGATALAAAIVTGQLLAGIGIDRFGLLGLTKRPLTASRLAGVALLVTGTVLTAG